MLLLIYKQYFKNILVGKPIDEYKDTKLLNKFSIFVVNFDDQTQMYQMNTAQPNTCTVAVKNGLITSILNVS